MSHADEMKEVVVRDLRRPGFYIIHNEIVDDYLPLIGPIGLALYNLYARREIKDNPRIKITQTVIRQHLGIQKASVSEYNLYLEWCGLIYINRKHRQTNEVYLLNVYPITPDHLDRIRQNIYAATRGDNPKPKNERIRTTILRRIDSWQGLNTLIEDQVDYSIEKVKAIRPNQPSLFDETPIPDDLQNQLISIIGQKPAERQLASFGVDRCAQALDLLPGWVDFYTRRDGSINSQGGILIWLITQNPGPASTTTLDEFAQAAVQAANLPAPEPPSQLDLKWNQVLDQLKLQMTKETFNSWVKETKLISHDDHQLTLTVKNEYAKEWLQNRLHDTISRTASNIFDQDLTINFVIDEQQQQPVTTAVAE